MASAPSLPHQIPGSRQPSGTPPAPARPGRGPTSSATGASAGAAADTPGAEGPGRRASLAGAGATARPPKSDRQTGWEAISRVTQLLQQPSLGRDAAAGLAAVAGGLAAAAAAPCGGGGAPWDGQQEQQQEQQQQPGPSVSVLQRGLRFDGDLTLGDLIRAFELRNAYDWDEDLSVPREPQVRARGVAASRAVAWQLHSGFAGWGQVRRESGWKLLLRICPPAWGQRVNNS
jgi:hypothetical protein